MHAGAAHRTTGRSYAPHTATPGTTPHTAQQTHLDGRHFVFAPALVVCSSRLEIVLGVAWFRLQPQGMQAHTQAHIRDARSRHTVSGVWTAVHQQGAKVLGIPHAVCQKVQRCYLSRHTLSGVWTRSCSRASARYETVLVMPRSMFPSPYRSQCVNLCGG